MYTLGGDGDQLPTPPKGVERACAAGPDHYVELLTGGLATLASVEHVTSQRSRP